MACLRVTNDWKLDKMSAFSFAKDLSVMKVALLQCSTFISAFFFSTAVRISTRYEICGKGKLIRLWKFSLELRSVLVLTRIDLGFRPLTNELLWNSVRRKWKKTLQTKRFYEKFLKDVSEFHECACARSLGYKFQTLFLSTVVKMKNNWIF